MNDSGYSTESVSPVTGGYDRFAVTGAGGQPPAAGLLPSPEQVRREIEGLLDRPLSPFLTRWSEAYAGVGKRSPYLWNWCRRAVELTTLPCVDPEWHDHVCDTKTLGVLFDVLLDDVADRSGDPAFLEELLAPIDGQRTPDFSRFSAQEQAYAEFASQVWHEIANRAQTYPRHAEFAAVLHFDYLQLANVMRYSHLLNGTPELLNLTEHDLYTPHNMHIMVCSTLDLMCSPGFDKCELGRLRELVWCAQCMGRIGNLVTTWQRELHEGDFTSGVYARAVMCGDLSVAQLRHPDPAVIEAAIANHGHETFFLRRWEEHRRTLLAREKEIRSFDVAKYAGGFQRLICLHLGSRGYK